MQAKKFWGWFVLAWLVAAFPLLLLHGVPGVDTPNHVARLHVLASLEDNSAMANFYRVHWALLPNLAVDLLITPLVYLFNLDALLLMKIFLVNLVGITGAGFAVLNRAISGKWSAWGLFGLVFSYSYVLGFGFINYLFGIGIALLFIGWQLLLAKKPAWRFVLLMIGLPLLLLNHLLALVLGMMTIVFLAIWQRDKCRWLWGGLGAGSVLSYVYMKLATTAPVSAGFHYDRPEQHLRNVFFPLYFSDLFRDLSFWLVVVGVVLFLVAKQKREFRLALWLLGGFLLVALALPHEAMTSAYISARISIWAVLVGCAALSEVTIKPSLILGLLFLRSGDVSLRFLSWNPTFDQLRADLRMIPSQSLVYQMVSAYTHPLQPQGWYPSLLHANCLLLLERDCFVENLFSLPYQQPLQNGPEIGNDERDLYNIGTPASIQGNLDRVNAHLNQMGPTLRKMPVFVYFVKTERDSPSPLLGKVLIERPRYVIYQLR